MLILEIMYFNPRSLTGATGGGIVAQLLEQFQSTLPRGSERPTYVNSVKAVQFQSTLPCGSDILSAVAVKRRLISIHAPLRERPAQLT